MRAIIVYGSFVGNTETMARFVAAGLEGAGFAVDLRDVINSRTDELLNYDLIVLGSPTYEPKMIQDDMLPLYWQLQQMELNGRLAAAFGPGDSAWPDFCTAVEMLEARLREQGARVVLPACMIDGIVEEQEAEARAWGLKLGRLSAQLMPAQPN